MKNQIQFYEDKLKYEIDSWDLSESLKNNEKVIVIDTRVNEAYNHEHIPSAINIPHRTIDEKTTQALDKEYMYVCYCDGIGCNASTKGTLNMTKLGFKTKELLGGLDWWKRDGHSTSISEKKNINCGC